MVGPTRAPAAQPKTYLAMNSRLLADEAKYCSFGNTVHDANAPQIFERCQGRDMFDMTLPEIDQAVSLLDQRSTRAKRSWQS